MSFARAANTVNDDCNASETASELQTSRSASASSFTRKRRYVDGNDDDYHDMYGYDNPAVGDMRPNDDSADVESDETDDADLMVSFRTLGYAADR